MIFDTKALAAHVLVVLASHRGRVLTLDDVAASSGARRTDVRAAVTRLHEEGFVDALRMRPTLAGLALASAFRACAQKDLRAGRAIAAA
jgi:hypothetical protein